MESFCMGCGCPGIMDLCPDCRNKYNYDEETEQVILKTVYKKNGDKVQKWSVEVEEDKYRTIEGFVDGAMTTSQWTVAVGKNIGKKNERTPENQAILEAGAKYRKKLDSGYVEDANEIGKETAFEPMLAHVYGDNKGKVTFPCYVQPKLDGMRCPVRLDGAFSRQNKPVNSVPHITDALQVILKDHPKLVFDGELYNHDLKSDFNTLISIVKKTKPTSQDLVSSAGKIQFHVYDMFDGDNPETSFEDRFMEMRQLLAEHNVSEKTIQVVRTFKVDNEKELDELYTKFLEEGYEGMMIRSNGAYQQKRTVNLLKRKEFVDGEFVIVDILEGIGNRSGMMGKFVMVTENGDTFEADGSGLGGHEAYEEMLENRTELIGLTATVRYQNLTPDRKVPRFPKVVAIRDYE